MRYQGSKRLLLKHILPIIERNMAPGQYYIEPFGGGMNMFFKVRHEKKVALDINRYLISLWNGLKSGEFSIPDMVTKAQYEDVKSSYIGHDGRYSDALIAFVGFCCSYGGGWWNGYANYNPNKNENHVKEAASGLRKQVSAFENLPGSEFICSDYRSYDYPENSVIYCDPPYRGTKGYTSDFDSDAFWNWVRTMSENGHTVFVSEYQAPDDFECIWEKGVKDGMGTTGFGKRQKVKVEKLFVYSKTIEKLK